MGGKKGKTRRDGGATGTPPTPTPTHTHTPLRPLMEVSETGSSKGRDSRVGSDAIALPLPSLRISVTAPADPTSGQQQKEDDVDGLFAAGMFFGREDLSGSTSVPYPEVTVPTTGWLGADEGSAMVGGRIGSAAGDGLLFGRDAHQSIASGGAGGAGGAALGSPGMSARSGAQMRTGARAGGVGVSGGVAGGRQASRLTTRLGVGAHSAGHSGAHSGAHSGGGVGISSMLQDSSDDDDSSNDDDDDDDDDHDDVLIVNEVDDIDGLSRAGSVAPSRRKTKASVSTTRRQASSAQSPGLASPLMHPACTLAASTSSLSTSTSTLPNTKASPALRGIALPGLSNGLPTFSLRSTAGVSSPSPSTQSPTPSTSIFGASLRSTNINNNTTTRTSSKPHLSSSSSPSPSPSSSSSSSSSASSPSPTEMATGSRSASASGVQATGAGDASGKSSRAGPTTTSESEDDITKRFLRDWKQAERRRIQKETGKQTSEDVKIKDDDRSPFYSAASASSSAADSSSPSAAAASLVGASEEDVLLRVEKWVSMNSIVASSSSAYSNSTTPTAADFVPYGTAVSGMNKKSKADRGAKAVPNLALMLLELSSIFPCSPEAIGLDAAAVTAVTERPDGVTELNDLVKKAYRRALLLVHPDKQPQGSSSARLTLATAVFSSLKNAFDAFQTQLST